MRMALDTALAINYLLVNVRTWIAFLTSALSCFWKIKSSSSSIHKDSPSPPPVPHDHQSSPPDHHHHHHHHQRSPPPPRQTSGEVLMSGRLETRRSGKFRVLYDDKQEVGDTNTNTSTRAPVICRRRRNNIDIVEEGWEAGLLKLKTADMGWYRHQDLTLFNGNVVQLWKAPNHFNLPTTLL